MSTSKKGWPGGDDAARLRKFARVGLQRPRVVLDTDTFNEIDDQFALVHTALAVDRLHLEAVCAAPFVNDRSSSPQVGMEKSFAEIHRVFDRLPGNRPVVLRGSDQWLSEGPVRSDAVDHIVEVALASDEPLCVVSIGAPTNIATALIQAPEVTERIVVVWLGGNPSYLPYEPEFNARQDLAATAALLDSGVALVLVPCLNVAEQLRTTHAEVARHLRPASSIGAYLADAFEEYHDEEPGYSKAIWDLAATAWVINRRWTTSHVAPAPLVAQDGRWIHGDTSRHLVLVVDTVDRDSVFADFFRRLSTSNRSH